MRLDVQNSRDEGEVAREALCPSGDAGSSEAYDSLANRQVRLRREHRRLVRASRAAHGFFSALSREFRTPLAVMKEYASLMRERVVGSVTEEQAKLLAIIEDRADDLNRMVDDALDVDALKQRSLHVRRRECQVGEIVAGVLPLLRQKARLNGVALEADVGPELPSVFCDDDKVARVIVNLVVNAIKFCGDPGRVRLWARPQSQAFELLVGVTDNGPGIDEAHQRAIFGRFRQLETTLPRGSTRGFGLGLSIAKEFVDLNLGRMALNSTPGEGSTFSFTLPYLNPLEITRRYVSRSVSSSATTMLTVVAVTMDEPVDIALADEMDVILHYSLKRHDLLLRMSLNTWLLILRLQPAQVPSHMASIDGQRIAERRRWRQPSPAFNWNVVGSWGQGTQRDDLLAAVAARVTH